MDHSANKTSGNHSGTGNDTGHEDHEGGDHEKAHGIHLVTVDFEHVKYPLVFGLVVILAGLSKIGKLHPSLTFTTLWDNSAEDQLMIVFLFVHRK